MEKKKLSIKPALNFAWAGTISHFTKFLLLTFSIFVIIAGFILLVVSNQLFNIHFLFILIGLLTFLFLMCLVSLYTIGLKLYKEKTFSVRDYFSDYSPLLDLFAGLLTMVIFILICFSCFRYMLNNFDIESFVQVQDLIQKIIDEILNQQYAILFILSVFIFSFLANFVWPPFFFLYPIYLIDKKENTNTSLQYCFIKSKTYFFHFFLIIFIKIFILVLLVISEFFLFSSATLPVFIILQLLYLALLVFLLPFSILFDIHLYQQIEE